MSVVVSPSALPTPAAESAHSSARAKSSKTLAALRVGVFPWGRVWIDGQPQGIAPVRAELSTGRHVVSAGLESPTASRAVTLKAGQEEQIVIDLKDQEKSQ